MSANECPTFPNDERCCMCLSSRHTCAACPTFDSGQESHTAPKFGTHVPKAPNMTQAHFWHIANTIASTPLSKVTREVVAETFADALAATNPRFKRDLFLRAAGVK